MCQTENAIVVLGKKVCFVLIFSYHDFQSHVLDQSKMNRVTIGRCFS